MIASLFSNPSSPLIERFNGLGDATPRAAEAISHPDSRIEILSGYLVIFVVAFLVSLVMTPIMAKLARANGIVDTPNDSRKIHREPIAYLGGVAVYLGIMAAIVYAFIAHDILSFWPFDLYEVHPSKYELHHVSFAILLGLTIIMVIGLLDDVVGLDPRLKVGGQLMAAAALAMSEIGTQVAQGVLRPIGRLVDNESLVYFIDLPFPLPGMSDQVPLDIVYWVGTGIIAFFVLGACNASNLVDGLDGLLSGVTSIACAGLLFISLSMALADDGVHDAARLTLTLALMGACMGFLPHNFNPARIFLGDCGSLLLGYTTIVIVLLLGQTGKTHLVIAGLIIYALPVLDTILAIFRRKLAGLPMSAPDDKHFHHVLKKRYGVKKAVLILYAVGAAFALLGAAISIFQIREVLTVAIVLGGFLGIACLKVGRVQALDMRRRAMDEKASVKREAAHAEASPRRRVSATRTPPSPTNRRP